jgi:hypothetical protein
MARLGSLFRKNIILGIKDVYVLLEIGFAVVIVLLLLFVIPEEIERDATVYVLDRTGIVQTFIDQAVGLEEMEESAGEFYVDSREELIEGMTDERSAVGLIIDQGEGGAYDVELLTQPYTTDAMIRYVGIDLEDLMALIAPPYDFYPQEVRDSVRVEALQSGLRDEIPFNQVLLPVVLMFMVGILGLFIMISLIGQERSELTLRAFQVSPGSLWEFLLGKHLVVMAISVATYSILYIPMMGFSGYLQGLLIVELTVVFGSCIGTFLGSLFDNPMSSVIWVLLLMIVLGLPAVSLFAPVFSPGWLRIIPTYHTLFGLDAAMFPDGNSHVVWQSVGILAAIDVVLVPVTFLLFGRKMQKEA